MALRRLEQRQRMKPAEQAQLREKEGGLWKVQQKAPAAPTASSCCFSCCPSLQAYPPCLQSHLSWEEGVWAVFVCVCWANGGKFSRPSVRSLGPPVSDRERSLCWLQSSGGYTCACPWTMQAVLGRGWSQNELLISVFPKL